MNRLINFLIRLERRLTSPRTLQQLRRLSWQWIAVRKRVLLLSVLVGALFVNLWLGYGSLIGRYGGSNPATGGTYREAVSGQSEILNPLFSPVNPVDQDAVSLIYSGLLRRDSKGRLMPDLAERYTASPDQKTYTVRLRPDLEWQDGVAVTSRDVTFTIGMVQSDDYQGPLRSEWRGVKVEAPDDRTIVFHLTTPYAFFPVDLTLPLLPWHLLRDVSARNLSIASFNNHPVGTGPFSFQSLSVTSETTHQGGKLQEISLKRNDHYVGPRPYLNQVTFKVYDTPHNAFLAYEKREVEAVSGIAAADANRAGQWETLTVDDEGLPQYTALFFNLGSATAPTTDKRVRQALALSIDRRAMIQTKLAGQAFPAYYPLVAGQVGYDPTLPRTPYSLAQAGDLLTQAGWAKGQNGKRYHGIKPLKLTIVTGQTDASQAVASYLRSQWARLGADVEIVTASTTELQSGYIEPRKYQILLYGENLGASGDLYPFWHSSQSNPAGLNLSSYSNITVDRALESARLTSDQSLIRQKYARMQRAWLDDIPAVSLYTPIYSYGVDDHVHGVTLGDLTVPSDRFASISQWYVNVKHKV